MDFNNIYTNSNKESGATAVIIALLLFVFIGLAAFVVDLGFLYASRAELQNAADAGALAGARVLYKSDGKTLNVDPSPDGAIFVAANTAKQNKSANSIVEVDPNLDVKRGLWSFGEGNLSRGFYSDMTSTTAVAIWKYSEQELDQNKDKDGNPLKDANGNNVGFINAVQVTAHRDATPVRAFFSKIFGNDGFKLSATSVAYLGFAGGVVEIDQPIAVCEDAVMKDGLPICNIGRMSDSRTTKEKEDDGSNPEDLANTGGWTDLVECDPTSSGGKAVDGTMSACNLESTPIALYSGIRTTGGVQNVTFSTGSDSFYKCWLGTPPTIPTEPWSITLPVVECPNNNLGTCSKLVGTIKVDVMWILPKKSDDSPSEMTDPGNDFDGDWKYSEDNECIHKKVFEYLDVKFGNKKISFSDMHDYFTGDYFDDNDDINIPENFDYDKYIDRWSSGFGNHYEEDMAKWDCFVDHFNMVNVSGQPAPKQDKAIYFSPSCDIDQPQGTVGGQNYGIMAKIPVLVK